MNTKKVLVLLVFITALAVFNLPQANAEDNYCWLTSSDTITTALDKPTFFWYRVGDWTYYDVWVRYTYNEQGAQHYIETLKKCKVPIEGYQNLDSTVLHLVYTSCTNRRMREIVSIVDYARDGSVINSVIENNPTWNQIIPGSVSETEFNALRQFTDQNNIPQSSPPEN